MFGRLSFFSRRTRFLTQGSRHFGMHSFQDFSTRRTLDTTPWEVLIRSIPVKEKQTILAELDSPLITQRAHLLCEELAGNQMIGTELDESRTLFLAALRNVKDHKITINQLATLHILDSAIRTLYINPMSYFTYRYVNSDQELANTFNLFTLMSLKGMPTSMKRVPFDHIPLPAENISLSQMPWRMQKPLMQRFFHFKHSEWVHFCQEMKQAPSSEQGFHILIAPEAGCWSSIIARIQKILTCMHVLDWLVETNNGDFEIENIMLVPSFSMFQAALNAKAHTLARKPVQLVPTYGYIDAAYYADLKMDGKIPLAIYLPEKSPLQRYQNEQGRFRTPIDGHPAETAFAGAIHDVYHAMREMAMSEYVAKAIMRLVWIARNHSKNKQHATSRPVDDILIDGELIYSWPPKNDTIFAPEYRPTVAQSFGDIFYITALKSALHEDLKHAFIEDMVVYKDDWREQYHLGKSDLRKPEQKMYEEIERRLSKQSKNEMGADFSSDDMDTGLNHYRKR